MFIAGQEFYAGARFPSLDFSLMYVLDERGEAVDMLIDKRGAKAVPARTIPAVMKRELDIPDHLETRIGRIARRNTTRRIIAHSSTEARGPARVDPARGGAGVALDARAGTVGKGVYCKARAREGRRSVPARPKPEEDPPCPTTNSTASGARRK